MMDVPDKVMYCVMRTGDVGKKLVTVEIRGKYTMTCAMYVLMTQEEYERLCSAANENPQP